MVRKRRKRKRRRSRNKSVNIMETLRNPKVFIPLFLIVAAAAIVMNPDLIGLTGVGGEDWDMQVNFSSVKVNGDLVDFNSDEDTVSFDAHSDKELSGSLSRSDTGFSPVDIGIGTWRSVYRVEDNDFVSDIGETRHYSEEFSAGNVIYTYKLLMEMRVRVILALDDADGEATVNIGGDVVPASKIPAIATQNVDVELGYETTTSFHDPEASVSVESVVLADNAIDGVVETQTPSGVITQLVGDETEPYSSSPYVSPVYPGDLGDIALEDGVDTFTTRFAIAPGVVRYNEDGQGMWLYRNVDFSFDVMLQVKLVGDEYEAARLRLPDGVADFVIGVFGFFPSLNILLDPAMIPILVIVIIVAVAIVIVMVYGRKSRGGPGGLNLLKRGDVPRSGWGHAQLGFLKSPQEDKEGKGRKKAHVPIDPSYKSERLKSDVEKRLQR